MSQAGILQTAVTPPITGSIGFEAFVSANQTNLTGDGTGFTVIFDDINWQNTPGCYDATTGIFTVPAGGAGKYLITYTLTLSNLTGSNTSGQFNTDTNLGTGTKKLINPSAALDAGFYSFNDLVVIELLDAQQLFITGQVSGGSRTVGLSGEFFGQFCYFSVVKLMV